MAITVEVKEDSGAVVSGHGTTRISVNNIGWKNSGLDETHSYPYYPIQRPETFGLQPSFKKYNYLKISGTYASGTRPKIIITNGILSGDISRTNTSAPTTDTPLTGITQTTQIETPTTYQTTNKVRLYYKLSSTYEVPDGNFDGDMIYVPPGGLTIYPRISTTGPESANTWIQRMSANTTYYTEYLITQLYVEPGAWDEYGNIGNVEIKFTFDEYETADL